MPFLQPWGHPYIPSCLLRISAQAGDPNYHTKGGAKALQLITRQGRVEHRNKHKQNALVSCPQDAPQEQG